MTVPDLVDGELDGARAMALLSALVLVGSFLTGFLMLTELFGGTPWLVAYVALALLGATLLARRVPIRQGIAAGVVLLAVGLLGYVVLLPAAFYGLFTPVGILEDMAGWISGQSAVLMLEADLWAVSVAPAPAFLTWYLALRRRYDAAALVGGAAMGFFVLTGDASQTTAMVGTVAALLMLAFGAIEVSDVGWEQVEEVGLVVGIAVLLGSLGGLARIVPARGVTGGDGAGDRTDLEEVVTANRDRLRARGSISLSPAPRLAVEADRAAYWHVNSFDHYDGSGWRRTNEHAGAAEPLTPPPGETGIVTQRFVAQADVERMPFAWKPVLLGEEARRRASVDRIGELRVERPLRSGEEYTLVSAVAEWDEDRLREAGETYPGDVERRYLQLPEDLPDRLVDRVDEIAAGAATPYDVAVAIQRWLAENKSYSTIVDRPEWDVADAFVFSIDSGYCVYFATTMAVMLRTQGIPARFVAGYAPGEETDDGRWLLRGFHSHTWVEVYFPGVGWVPFDPTPAGGRRRAREERMQGSGPGSGAGEGSGSDGAAGSGPAVPSPSPSPSPTPTGGSDSQQSVNATANPGLRPGDELPTPRIPGRVAPSATPENPRAVQPRASGATPTPTPSPNGGSGGRGDRLWLLGALATLAFGSVRLGYAQSAVRSVWKRWQPRTDSPAADVERALARLEYHLSEVYRERGEGETRVQFLRAAQEETTVVDARAWRVLELYHQSHYGDGVSREDADTAIQLVDEVVRR